MRFAKLARGFDRLLSSASLSRALKRESSLWESGARTDDRRVAFFAMYRAQANDKRQKQ